MNESEDKAAPLDEAEQVVEDGYHSTETRMDDKLLLEGVLSTEFFSTLSKTVLALLVGEAIVADDSSSGYHIDAEKASEIAGELVKQRNKREFVGVEQDRGKELTLEELQQAFRQSLQALRNSGVVPGELMGQVARIIKPSDAFISDAAFARFVYLNDRFPSKEGQRGELEVGTEIVFSIEQQILKAAREVGLEIDAQQQRNLALRLIATHEYGHAVHSTKIIQKVEVELANRPDEFYEVVNEQNDKFNRLVTYEIALEPELAVMFDREETISYSANDITTALSERIATGFQYVGAAEALSEMGVEEEDKQAFLQALQAQESQRLREAKLVLKTARDSGLTADVLSSAVNAAALALRRQKSAGDELLTGGFGARVFGYFYPLEREQLQKMIEL